jgi:retinol dehydrogenase-12
MLNAGIMAVPAGTTEQGYEIQFGTNHIGHALLAKLLLPTLLKTAKLPGADVRVITLASIGHVMARGVPFGELKSDMKGHLTWERYGNSKLANILFVRELAGRYKSEGITAVAIHPGIVDTDLYKSAFSGIMGWMDKAKGWVYTNVEGGAKNQLWAATTKLGEKNGEVQSGEYYTPVGVAGQGTSISGDMLLAGKLWEWTEQELKGYEL